MADNGQIVRDIMRAQPTVVTTPDYQSPNGAAGIISGIGEGFGKLLSAGSKSSGGSDKTYNNEVYKLFKDEAEYLSANTVGESELINRNREVITKALKVAKGDLTSVKASMEMAGYKDYQGLMDKMYEKDAASKQAQYELIDTAGAAAIGIDAPSNLKEIAGYNYLNNDAVRQGFYKALSMTSPSQQAAMSDNSNTAGLVEAMAKIRTDWRDFMVANPGAAPGMLFNNYTNDVITSLTNNGIDYAVAQKIVNRALVLDRQAIFGEEGAKKGEYAAGLLELGNDYQSKANSALQAMSEARFLATPITVKIRQGKNIVPVTLSGADWVAREKGAPNLIKTLSESQMLEIFPQLLSTDKQYYNNQSLHWMFSQESAKASNGAQNQTVTDNIEKGKNDFLNSVVQEKNSADPRSLVGNGFGDIQQDVQIMQVLDKEAIDATDPEIKVSHKDLGLRSIASGTNIETSNEGFWQVDSQGKLHYFRYGGNTWSGKPTLVDATESSSFLGYGSSSAGAMRRLAPVVEGWLKGMQDVYGFDKEQLYEDFNRAQLKHTRAAQTFRANQLRNSSKYVENLQRDMTEDDVDEMLQIVSQSTGADVPGMLGRALDNVVGGVEDAAKITGAVTEAVASAPTAGILAAGEELGKLAAWTVSGEGEKQVRRELSQAPTQSKAITPKIADRQVTKGLKVERNNPLGITKNPERKPVGASSKQDSSRFVTYNTLEDAYRDGSKILDAYFKRGDNTIAFIISKWAPPSENPTGSYIDFVSDQLNVASDQELSNTPEIKALLLSAMASFEMGGLPMTYQDVLKAITK